MWARPVTGTHPFPSQPAVPAAAVSRLPSVLSSFPLCLRSVPDAADLQHPTLQPAVLSAQFSCSDLFTARLFQWKSTSPPSVDASSCASFSSESDYPGESNTCHMVVDLVFRCKMEAPCGSSGAVPGTAKSETCQLSAPVRQALVWAVFAPPCREAGGGWSQCTR